MNSHPHIVLCRRSFHVRIAYLDLELDTLGMFYCTKPCEKSGYADGFRVN